MLCRPVTGWGLANLEADRDTVGAIFQRQVLQETMEAVLAAGWRPPARTVSTEDELAACHPGTVVTDRDGHPWVLGDGGQWCEPMSTGVDPDELLEWAPLTRHLDGGDRWRSDHEGLSVVRGALRARWIGRQGSAAMSTVVDAVADGLTVSMVEVDAAAARAALTDHLRLDPAELEQPALVAVLAAVVAAGWRPPVPVGDRRQVTGVIGDADVPALFATERIADSAGIGDDRGGPPGRRR